jgi:hypothetical protein
MSSTMRVIGPDDLVRWECVRCRLEWVETEAVTLLCLVTKTPPPCPRCSGRTTEGPVRWPAVIKAQHPVEITRMLDREPEGRRTDAEVQP